MCSKNRQNMKNNFLFPFIPASGLLVLLTVGMEELAAFLIFECPCNSGSMDNFVYGMSYLLGPAIILFLIGLAYQVKFERIYDRLDSFI